MTICWFGIYNPDFGRNKIYINALKKAGNTVIECRDDSRGFIKYWRLWKKHREIRNDYDAMIVGYPGHIIVPLAKLISPKPVIADLLGSLCDAEVNSHYPSFFKKIKAQVIDFVAVWFADVILLEREAQKKFFEEKFGKSVKYEVMYTGADEKFNDTNIRMMRMKQMDINGNNRKFMVLIRGKLTPECGIMHILKAAEILENNKNIYFRIIGSGYFLNQTEKFLHQRNLPNVELISRFLPAKELIEKIEDADLILGQFGDNPRLSRTIPHKAFEAFAMGIPYLTGDGLAIREIAEDGINVFFVPLANPTAIAHKIESLVKQPELLRQVAVRARKVFEEKFAPAPLVERLVKIML